MARQQYMEMANFICRFGDNFTMTDLLDEIVIPAFAGHRERTYKDTRYFFHGVSLILLEHDQTQYPAIAGRIVKDTKLSRSQIFDQSQGLIQSEVTIPTAPSSMFLLILEGHRLLYVKEQVDSPGLEAFRSTVDRFLAEAYFEFIDNAFIYAKQKSLEGGQKVTKKALKEEIPRPTLELIEIASEQGLREFIHRYKTLRDVKVSLVQTNDEIDNDQFFKDMRSQKDKIGSDRTTLQHHRKDGLDPEAAFNQVNSAIEGKAVVSLDGLNQQGERLVGNNEEFKIRIPIPDLGSNIKVASRMLMSAYTSVVQQGLVKATAASAKAIAAINKSLPHFKD